ncbi:oligosaccharide flippase family protein [Candidatus Woesearchaeota archaeon]|nr:oligosaccharide flippase family protein [Candidatus Woesearchaeota archaeon]
MALAKTIIKNTGFLFWNEIINKLLSFFLVIIITRYLGDVGYGKYSFAFAFISLFIMLSHIGLTTYIFREIAKDRQQAGKLLSSVFSLKILLISLLYLIIIPVSYFMPTTKKIILVILLVAIHESFTVMNSLIGIVYKAFEKGEYNSYSTMIDRILALVFAYLVLTKGYGIYVLMGALILSKIFAFVFNYFTCTKKFAKIQLSADFGHWKKLVRNSLPFWFTLIFRKIYYETDKVMLAAFRGFAVTGWYSAAATLIGALTVIPSIITYGSFPAMARFHHQGSKKLLKILYKKVFYYLLVIGIPVVIGISLLSGRIIIFIYSNEFIRSGFILKILSWGLLLIFLNHIMGNLLNAINKQSLFTLSTGISAFMNILLNAVLIPFYSYIGAAFATIATQAVNFFVLYYFTSKEGYPLNMLSLTYKPLIAAIIMALAVYIIRAFHILYIIPIAALVYFCMLIILGGLEKEEINLIRSFKKGK